MVGQMLTPLQLAAFVEPGIEGRKDHETFLASQHVPIGGSRTRAPQWAQLGRDCLPARPGSSGFLGSKSEQHP